MTEEPTIDPATIATLRELSPGDDSFLQEIIGIFLQDSPVRLQEIRDGIKAGDAKLVTRAAHSLKGSSGNFGARRMQHASKEIEHLAGQGKLTEALVMLPSLEAEYAAVAKALQALA